MKKCFICGKGELENRTAVAEGEIKGEKYTVETQALVCNTCGHTAIEGKHAQEFMRRVSDAYRRAHNLLTSDRIRSIRGGLTQLQFAQELEVGLASVKRWELGLVQDKSSDRLMRDFEKYSKRRYVYDIPAVAAALSALSGNGPEGRAHGPPPHGEPCLSLIPPSEPQ